MKKNNTITIWTIIKVMLFAAMIAFDIWVFISWLNIAFNNTSPELVANQWTWNFFRVFFKG